MDLNQATDWAEAFTAFLGPACARIEVVGSVKRRDKPTVHDLEILMILNGRHPVPAFGDKVVHKTMLDKIIFDLKAQGVLRDPLKKANGEKYKKFAITSASQLNEFYIDLFIVNERTWGIQNVIRTGPRYFSHAYVTPYGEQWLDRESGVRGWGLLTKGLRYVRGATCIMEGETVLDLPEERDAIELLGHGWIEPGKRRNYVRLV